MTIIRLATPDDVDGISAVVETCFGEKLDIHHAKDIIADQKQIIWVADDNGSIIGFVSAFLSRMRGAIRRWEIDLLGVMDTQRQQGISQRLLGVTWQDALKNKSNFARALVRVDNIAAQKAFAKAGYATQGPIYELHIWKPLASDAKRPEARGIISATPVETLLYRGIWLEGLDMPMISDENRQQAILGGRAWAARSQYDQVSTLVALEKPLPDELRSSAHIAGQYQWWRKP